MPDGASITMENNPTETTKAVDVEAEIPATTNPEADATANAGAEAEGSTSTEDLTALIEAEKKHGKPDPAKARERIEKKFKPVQEEEEEEDEEERPVTRRELAEMLARQAHENTLISQEDTIIELSESLGQTSQEAELIRSIHANRIFPVGMPLREQLAEAAAIANVKRVEARNAELTRKIQSQNTVSRNTATTHRDPQANLEPDMAPDLKVSMQRAGYIYNSSSRRYEKKLPNGKTLVKENGKPPYLAN